MSTVHEFEATTIDGTTRSMGDYSGQVLLVVNTASQCGFTPQYRGLQTLQDTYGPRGFNVLGFPCDQFGHQEPGDEASIEAFCSLTYDVTFPMFAKVEVNGGSAHPLYEHLRAEKGGLLGGKIRWNFTKFLVDAHGGVVQRYAPTTAPAKIAGDIEALLAA